MTLCITCPLSEVHDLHVAFKFYTQLCVEVDICNNNVMADTKFTQAWTVDMGNQGEYVKDSPGIEASSAVNVQCQLLQ